MIMIIIIIIINEDNGLTQAIDRLNWTCRYVHYIIIIVIIIIIEDNGLTQAIDRSID